MKNLLFLLLLGCFPIVNWGQEICDNGIDDDADGFIDYQDTADCSCKLGQDTTYRLIPNSSFEDTICCPSFVGGGELNCAKSWQQASIATSDYFNTCGLIQVAAPSMNPPPLPLPHGKGYVGFFNGAAASPLNLSNYKEYIGTCLTDTLFAGVSYQIQFNIAHGKGNYTTKVGIFGSGSCTDLPFGLTPFFQGCPANGPKFVALDSVTVTTSGTNWTVITLSFVPPIDLTTLVIGPNCRQMLGNNYYYLDGLQLSKGQNEPIGSITDTGTYCQGNMRLFARSDSTPISFQWYKDSVALVGETDSTYQVPIGRAGNYQVKLTFGMGCLFTQSFNVQDKVFPIANFSYDTVCEGSYTSFTNRASIPSGRISSWKWSSPPISTLKHPNYRFSGGSPYPVNLQVTSDSGCIHDTTINVITYPNPKASFNYTPSQIYVYNPQVCFTNTSINANSYFWNFGFSGLGSTSTVTSPCPISYSNGKADTYSVKLLAYNQFGCIDSTILNLSILKGNILFIPNSFTPNKDKKNDLFLPITDGVDNYELTIFNRWGEIIFTSIDNRKGWDGTYLGKNVEQGIYVYVIKTKNISKEVQEIRGHVNVIY